MERHTSCRFHISIVSVDHGRLHSNLNQVASNEKCATKDYAIWDIDGELMTKPMETGA